MKSAKSLDAAIEKGAFMVYADDWKAIKGLSPTAIGKALYLAVMDSWHDESDDAIGNGFLGIPRNRINEIAKTEDAETVAIYTTLIRSNIAARKTYIKGNPLLANALEKLKASRAEDKVAAAN